MIALILVAGNSRRMGDLTTQLHKTLLDVGGQTIFQRLLNALKHEKITEICFVAGYRKNDLQDYFRDNFSDFVSHWVDNPVFDKSNTGYSVWLTREVLEPKGQDILLINGDVILDYRCIRSTLHQRGKTTLAVRLDRVAEEEVKVRLDDTGQIIEIGKHITPANAAGESVGINLLSADLLPRLYDTLEKRIREGNGQHEFYEVAFNQLISEGETFHAADVSNHPVMEVDTPEDYREALRTIVPDLVT